MHEPEDSRFLVLVEEQRAVADSVERGLLVLGGAGVGKTTTALWAARRHLLDHGRKQRPSRGDRVLIVAFSRTAVGQIRARSAGVLDGLGDHVEIATYHGLAYRLIRAFASLLGLDSPPTMQSDARDKLGLGGPTAASLRYSDLIPMATQVITTAGVVSELVTGRWGLVISDEFQDTSDEEWAFLDALSANSRLILLADEHQMIYDGFKQGVAARLDTTRATSRFREVTLPPISHRDPTQLIPTLATEVRTRRFDGPALRQAINEERMLIRTDVDEAYESRIPLISELINGLRSIGHETFGVYGRGNADAANLSLHLLAHGVEHVPVGFGEAFGEALAAQMTMVDHAVGSADWADVRVGLAVAMTASDRGSNPPALAIALRDGTWLPAPVADGLDALRRDLETSNDLVAAAAVAAGAMERLALTRNRNWTRAGEQLSAAAFKANLLRTDGHAELRRMIDELRTATVVSGEHHENGSVQVMNFNQTKGRQADAVILNCLSSDWFGRGKEPWASPSRLLYVALTRAERSIVILLPPQPHPLFAPFTSVPGPLA